MSKLENELIHLKERQASEAAYYIQEYCRKYGRMWAHGKEKYGTVRVYVIFGMSSLHSLIYPSYAYNQFPRWLWILDINYLSPVISFFFNRLFTAWQQFIYVNAYKKALKLWPTIKNEILIHSDFRELIKL